MFPTKDYQAFLAWLETPSVPTLAVLQSALAVAQYLVAQAVATPDARPLMAAGAAATRETLIAKLKSCHAMHAAPDAAAKIDWKGLLALLLQLLPSLFGS